MEEIVAVNDKYYPSLGLKMYLYLKGANNISLYSEDFEIDDIKESIPAFHSTDEVWKSQVRFYKFYNNTEYTHKTYHASDIIRSYRNIKEGKKPVIDPKEFDGKVVEAIARQNPHQLVFLLTYEDQRQLAIYHGKLYRTEWMPDEELKLDAHGFSLEEIWNGLIEQIALYEERASSSERLSIDQRLALQEKILKLEKQIKKTEAAAWKETQPKKRFDLYQRVQKYKQELEGLKNGES
jgi:hypothetical protein